MKIIWLVNPYGPIEGENWREYSFNQFGKYLSQKGFLVVWWTANFSHHFKTFRSKSWQDIAVNENFTIRLVPTNAYLKNISFGRFYKDYVFGRNALKRFKKEQKPDLIIAAENPMCLGRPAFSYAYQNMVPIVYDQMDIWPEFLINVLPKSVQAIANMIMWPVYKRREYIYSKIDGSIALGKHYLEFMFHICPELRNKPHALVYNGIDVDEFRSHLNEKINNEKIPSIKKEGEIWCVFAGTLGPSYDIQGIIECATSFEERKKNNFRFIIAGSGPLEENVRAAESKLNNLIYVGKLLPKELIPIYNMCDIGLSTYSAGSNVDMCDKFYDYTAAGLAVVNSLTGEVSEHIEAKEIGENYVAGDSKSLQAALLKFMDESYLHQAKTNSRITGKMFDMLNQNNHLLAVVNQLI